MDEAFFEGKKTNTRLFRYIFACSAPLAYKTRQLYKIIPAWEKF